MAVRVATVADAGTLARLLFDFNTEFEADTDPESEFVGRFERLLADDGAVLALLSEDGPEANGFALVTLRPVIWFDGPVATLDELYVAPALRARGLGGELLSEARRLLAERGCPEMHVNVDEIDVDTCRFYERHGFVNIEPGVDYRMLLYIGSTDRQA